MGKPKIIIKSVKEKNNIVFLDVEVASGEISKGTEIKIEGKFFFVEKIIANNIEVENTKNHSHAIFQIRNGDSKFLRKCLEYTIDVFPTANISEPIRLDDDLVKKVTLNAHLTYIIALTVLFAVWVISKKITLGFCGFILVLWAFDSYNIIKNDAIVSLPCSIGGIPVKIESSVYKASEHRKLVIFLNILHPSLIVIFLLLSFNKFI